MRRVRALALGRRRRKRGLLLACGGAVTALVVGLHAAGGLDGLEHDSVDARFAVRGATSPPADLVVVGIDDATFGDFDLRFQDWPRTFHARLLRRLARAGTRAVIYDIQITEPSGDDDADWAFYEAAGEARPVIFATEEVDERGGTGVFGSDAQESAANLREIGAHAGHAGLPTDPGGVIRRLDHTRQKLRSLGVVAADVVGTRRTPPPEGGSAWLDYRGPPRTIDYLSFSHVHDGKVARERLRGKVVFVGLTAPTLQDVHATSAGGGQMSGAEIQANAFDTARRGFPLRSAGGALDVLLIVLLGLVAPLLCTAMSALRALLIAVPVAAAFAVAAQVAFERGTVVLVVAPLLALATASVAALAVDYFTEVRERRRLHAMFSRFVPEAVADALVARGEARLGGERIVSTVMFCDLRAFTSFAEHLDAEQVIEVLNTYLGEMSAAVLDHGGTLVAYMGDGIMAVFGAPQPMDDHADRAVATALEMLRVRLPRFNAWIADQGIAGSFEMGIGINSGPVMSGNVGSERRMEYAAVGDTTNTAARLEAMTKDCDHQLFVASSTYEMLTRTASALERHDEVTVRGRTTPMTVWVPAGGPPD